MDLNLAVTLTRTFDRQPVAILHNMPGRDAELRPAELRSLAGALLQAARDCEANEVRGPHPRNVRREYAIEATDLVEAMGRAHRSAQTTSPLTR